MDLETCRICACFYTNATEQELIPIFELHDQEHLQLEQSFILNEINSWNLNIAHNDGLPQVICANCFAKFSTINAFRQECEATQKLLREALATQVMKIDETTETIEVPMDNVIEQANDGDLNMQEFLRNQQDVEENGTPDVMINFKVSFDDNAPNRIVINEESTATDASNQIVTNTVVRNIENLQNSTNVDSFVESNNLVTMSEDLEEMLTGSVIQKNVNRKRQVQSDETKSEEKCELSDNEDDYIDERAINRLLSYPFVCNYCYCPPFGKTDHLIFKSNDELSQHFFDEHDPKAPYTCPKCPKLFTMNKRRNFHVTKTHNEESKPVLRCQYCKKIIRTSAEIHENSCTYISDWKCKVCDREFRQMPRHSFRAHQRAHTTPKYRCQFCKRIFMRRRNFETHQKTHDTIVPQRQWQLCIECDQSFPTLNKLKQHEATVHSAKAVFPCQYCDNSYTTFGYLQRHIRSYHVDHNRLKDEATCSNCGITFPSEIKLYFHQQRLKDENGRCILQSSPNSRQRPVSCPHCPKRFATQHYLDEHLEIHEEQMMSHQCEKCPLRFHTKLGLMEHMKSNKHSNPYKLDNPKLSNDSIGFKCTLSECKANFSTEADLSQHLSSNHEPVSCEFCSEIFSRGELKVHQNSGRCHKTNDLNNLNGSIDASDIDPDSLSSSGNSNVCVQFNNQRQSISLKDNRNSSMKSLPNVLNFLQSDALPNIINNPNVPLNDDDYFISSLLDPDNEIIVA